MVQHLCKTFLVDAAEYRSAQARWSELWDKLVAAQRPTTEWKSPWFASTFADGTPMSDGNPIFSAVSPVLKRGIRIVQHEPTTNQLEFEYWLDTAGDEAERIQELVISCALSREAEQRVEELLRTWILGGSVLET